MLAIHGFRHSFELGIILAIVGTQISKVITELFGNSGFNMTYLVFLLSLLLVADYNSLFRLELKISKAMLLILGYNIYVLVAALFAGEGLFTQNQGIIYTLYVIVFLLLVATNQKKIDEDFFISAAWWITGLGTMLLMWVLTDGFSNISSRGFTWTSGGSDRLTLSVLPFVHLVTVLLYEGKSWFTKILKLVFAVGSLYMMSICSRRGLMIAFIIILVFHFGSSIKNGLTTHKVFNILKTVCIIALVIFVVTKIYPDSVLMVTEFYERIVKGMNTYMGNFSSGIDAAAVQRNNVWNTVPSEYLNSSLKVIIFGNGYGTRQLDIPYLQAFTDLGLIGGIYYLIIELCYPIKVLLINKEEKFFKFASYIGIMTITYNLYSGVPYNHYKFVGIILLAYAEAYYKKLDHNIEEH